MNRRLTYSIGHERFSSMVSSFYRGCDGAIVVYDVTNNESFINVDKWIEEFHESTNETVPILVCANKIDLTPRIITEEAGKQWCDTYNYGYIECSACKSIGVDDLFQTLGQMIVNSAKPTSSINTDSLKPIEIKDEKSCC